MQVLLYGKLNVMRLRGQDTCATDVVHEISNLCSFWEADTWAAAVNNEE